MIQSTENRVLPPPRLCLHSPDPI